MYYKIYIKGYEKFGKPESLSFKYEAEWLPLEDKQISRLKDSECKTFDPAIYTSDSTHLKLSLHFFGIIQLSGYYIFKGIKEQYQKDDEQFWRQMPFLNSDSSITFWYKNLPLIIDNGKDPKVAELLFTIVIMTLLIYPSIHDKYSRALTPPHNAFASSIHHLIYDAVSPQGIWDVKKLDVIAQLLMAMGKSLVGMEIYAEKEKQKEPEKTEV